MSELFCFAIIVWDLYIYNLKFYSLGPRFLFGARSCSSDFFSWPEAMRPMARSAASIERSVVREWSWSFEQDSLTARSWTWPPVSMFTPPVRTLSILEKLRLLSREEPLKVVPFRVNDMSWGM